MPAAIPAVFSAASIGTSIAKSQRDKKAAESAQRLAEQQAMGARQAAEAQAQGLRQAVALTPEESALRSATLSALQGRIRVPGETLFGRQGPVSSTLAADVLAGIQQPGRRFESVVGGETSRAIEEGVLPTFAARGISPTSPIVAEAGRREARDRAIQSALLRQQAIEADVGRAERFGATSSALEQSARLEALEPTERAVARQAAGQEAAAGIGAQAALAAPSLQTAREESLLKQKQAEIASEQALLAALATALGQAGATGLPGKDPLSEAIKAILGGVQPTTARLAPAAQLKFFRR